TYAFESPKVFDKLLIPTDSDLRKTVVISNPLGEDFSVMRTQPVNAILNAVAFNYNHRAASCKLYDLSNIYLPKSLPLTELPDEREQLSLCAYGSDVDFYSMKGVVIESLMQLGLRKDAEFNPVCERPYLHPGRKAEVVYEGKTVGYLGEIHPDVCVNYGFKENARVYIAVLDVPALLEFADFDRKYTGIARFPAVTRDIAMVVPKSVLAGDIEKILKQRGGKLLESIKLFDIYEGEQVEKGHKSMAYSLAFRASDKTLTDDDVNAVMKKILNGLASIGAELRA
ncbi:MAG: phenylalanine--tRNA ligase subunit beta, partial [Eubacteriales bacterium]|nr:phenylalanine--tRNA ligase subunit beta [Eubacteriales bacterium]